ncbi:hypothetical protein DIU31_021625 [Mucilaginibacter rubeus]|uniref:Thiopeptide-type bacteriocin biosynthesis domain-containing protein n=1 Tax=Mucilaginibacter rubeus TaxID=2027860 RepID=A0AAE6JI08_9SPHI|nr:MULTISPECIES: hypothetical protein [Mucilaginibacter]QEM05981.1 hypothetical protein DIU31_021625 [Mucilaginibacter rubeus]QEM18561.1 hypothetical protein DIU38_021840 [Mucilaginibacter gossypii]QTE44897.1 hypothetical protein J3L19_05875 [Mucilaginibacter rubeus]QTE51495.1 hypothetical protein J3L21_05850 [Mucilaginibacter rubeus]QTE56581.1 hypothetical protein J3L23_31095 [Mucilaginibacter rubeus]
MTNRTLIRFSIYYADQAWQELIKNVIAPFLKQNQAFIAHFYIFLSNYRGDHIKLILEPEKGYKTALINSFRTQVLHFLAEMPSSEPSIRFTPGKSIWMNYANNSFEINNYDTYFLTDASPLLDFTRATSRMILNQFLSGQIEEMEDIINLATHLLLKLISNHVDTQTNAFFDSMVKQLINDLGASSDSETIDQVLEDSAEAATHNKHILLSFCAYNTVDEESSLEDQIILSTWLIQGQKLISGEGGKKFIETFCYQIGLSELSKLYVLNLIGHFWRHSRQS